MNAQQFKTIVGDKLKAKKAADEKLMIAEAVEAARVQGAQARSGSILSRLIG